MITKATRIPNEQVAKIETEAKKQKRTFAYILRDMLNFAINHGYFKKKP
jgi:predicted DNA-binding protein